MVSVKESVCYNKSMATPPIAINHPFSCYPYYLLFSFFSLLYFFHTFLVKTSPMTMGGVLSLCEHSPYFDDLAHDVNNCPVNACEDPWRERRVC